MAWKDGRNEEFAMFETGLFDPIWGEFNWGREGRCTVPCFKDYGVAFQGTRGAIKDEWESYDGKPLSERVYQRELELRSRVSDSPPSSADEIERASVEALAMEKGDADVTYGGKPYTLKEDKYPPNNRTLENFFRGAWSYHIHNQWTKHPQPNSWFDIAQKAHDGFLQGTRKNVYGESWTGPDIPAYDRWPEFD
jgi:hypothetical protein